jgi:hypothetical protein
MEDIYVDVFNEIMSRALILNQRDNQNEHLIGLWK